MRKLLFIIMMIAALLVSLAGAREKLLDSRIKITENDTDKKKILLVADLPPSHDNGYLDVELRVSKGGPNIMYSFQFEGVERAFGSINRDTPAERLHLPITPNDVQAQMYFWYTSGIGVCEIRVIIYLSEETESGTISSGGETEPSGSRFAPPPGEEDQGPGAVGPPGETEPEKVTPPAGKEPEKVTTPPTGKEPEKVTPPTKETTTPSSTTTTEEEKKKKTETTPPPESKETKKTTETTSEPTPPGEEPSAPGSE
jgi:hypothetical protein